jgi:lipopolysaccharide export LptBFGC system permease protein LptF
MDIKFLLIVVFFIGCVVGALLMFSIEMILAKVDDKDRELYDFAEYVSKKEGKTDNNEGENL